MINLLSAEEKKKIRSDYRFRVLSACLPLFAGVLLFAFLTLLPSFFFAQISNVNMLKESQSAEVVNKKTQETEMKNIVLATNKKISLLNKSLFKNTPAVVFDEILKRLPEGVTVVDYEYQKNSVTQKIKTITANIVISGVAQKREIILAFVDSLRQNKNFTSVDLPVASLVNESNFSYSINIVAKDSN